jgi:hypothetical protein
VLSGKPMADLQRAVLAAVDDDDHLERAGELAESLQEILDDGADVAGLVASRQDERNQGTDVSSAYIAPPPEGWAQVRMPAISPRAAVTMLARSRPFSACM